MTGFSSSFCPSLPIPPPKHPPIKCYGIHCSIRFENVCVYTCVCLYLRKLQHFPEAGPGHGDTEDGEDAQRDLENKLARIISQTSMEEQQYETEQKVNRQVRSWSMY